MEDKYYFVKLFGFKTIKLYKNKIAFSVDFNLLNLIKLYGLKYKKEKENLWIY